MTIARLGLQVKVIGQGHISSLFFAFLLCDLLKVIQGQ